MRDATTELKFKFWVKLNGVMPRRVVICGGPRCGKTTLSEKLVGEFGISNLHTSQELERLFPANQSNGENWSKSSEHASKWFDEDGDWICEGVQMARGLRKWLEANPGKPLDADVIFLRQPFVPLVPGQDRMRKGIISVLEGNPNKGIKGIEKELIKRGARVHKLKSPEDAIEILLAREGQDDNKEAGSLQMPKFNLKAKVENLEDAPEKYRAVYVEREGAFHLDPAKLEGIEFDDPIELGGALEKERKARAQAEKDLKAERDKLVGVDLDEYNRLKAEADNKENDDLKSQGKIDELLKKQREPLEAKIAEQKQKYEDTITTLNAELDRVTIDGALRSAYEKAGVIADRMDDAIALTRGQAKREDGKLALYDTDGLKLDISLDAFAKEVLFTAKPYLFQATSTNGTGAQNGTHGANGKKQYKRSDLEKQHPQVAAGWMKEVSAGQAELVDQ